MPGDSTYEHIEKTLIRFRNLYDHTRPARLWGHQLIEALSQASSRGEIVATVEHHLSTTESGRNDQTEQVRELWAGLVEIVVNWLVDRALASRVTESGSKELCDAISELRKALQNMISDWFRDNLELDCAGLDASLATLHLVDSAKLMQALGLTPPERLLGIIEGARDQHEPTFGIVGSRWMKYRSRLSERLSIVSSTFAMRKRYARGQAHDLTFRAIELLVELLVDAGREGVDLVMYEHLELLFSPNRPGEPKTEESQLLLAECSTSSEALDWYRENSATNDNPSFSTLFLFALAYTKWEQDLQKITDSLSLNTSEIRREISRIYGDHKNNGPLKHPAAIALEVFSRLKSNTLKTYQNQITKQASNFSEHSNHPDFHAFARKALSESFANLSTHEDLPKDVHELAKVPTPGAPVMVAGHNAGNVAIWLIVGACVILLFTAPPLGIMGIAGATAKLLFFSGKSVVDKRTKLQSDNYQQNFSTFVNARKDSVEQAAFLWVVQLDAALRHGAMSNAWSTIKYRIDIE